MKCAYNGRRSNLKETNGQSKELHVKKSVSTSIVLACVAGVQRGGRGKVECECEARSHSTFHLPPLCTPATQASIVHVNVQKWMQILTFHKGCEGLPNIQLVLQTTLSLLGQC